MHVLDSTYRKKLRKVVLSKISSVKHGKSAKYIQFLAVLTQDFSDCRP